MSSHREVLSRGYEKAINFCSLRGRMFETYVSQTIQTLGDTKGFALVVNLKISKLIKVSESWFRHSFMKREKDICI